jgi:hypothetical protein
MHGMCFSLIEVMNRHLRLWAEEIHTAFATFGIPAELYAVSFQYTS